MDLFSLHQASYSPRSKINVRTLFSRPFVSRGGSEREEKRVPRSYFSTAFDNGGKAMSANRCSILHDSSARTVYVVTVHTRILIRVFPLISLPFIKTSFGENRARREIANNVASKFAASLGSMAKRETVAGLFIAEWNDTSGQTFEDSCQGNCDKCFALRRKLIYFANLFLSITHLFTFSLYTSDS